MGVSHNRFSLGREKRKTRGGNGNEEEQLEKANGTRVLETVYMLGTRLVILALCFCHIHAPPKRSRGGEGDNGFRDCTPRPLVFWKLERECSVRQKRAIVARGEKHRGSGLATDLTRYLGAADTLVWTFWMLVVSGKK